jgi:DNA-binding CsgD family transcriptional regulator
VPRGLTSKQFPIAQLLCVGKTQKQIAEITGVAPNTIKSHVDAIYDRLEVSSKSDLILKYGASLRLSTGSIAGYWLSRFEYQSKSLSSGIEPYVTSAQVNLEVISEIDDSYFTHTGLSLCSAPTHKLAFNHGFNIKLFGQVACGIWEN